MSESNKNVEFKSVLGPSYNESFFADANGKLGRELDETGILVLSDFVSNEALTKLKVEAASLKKDAYKAESVYNLFVLPEDSTLPSDSPRNRKFKTTKGCAPDDTIPQDSVLRKIYDAPMFREFICKLQRLDAIYPYADTLSSININYYDKGDSLEWHFDNADFAITLLIKQCDEGGIYEYAPNVRYYKNQKGDTRFGKYWKNVRYNEYEKVDYDTLGKIIDGEIQPKTATMSEGSLMIFRGNRSLHRVTKVEKGDRVLVTLNYNLQPGIPLSEKSRKTFFGRTE